MANYLTQNERFHIFSKSPIDTKTTINQAVNKSGHTVTLSDIWADDIPWFTEVSGEQDAIARAADASYNDLILWGNDIYKRKGDKTNGASTGTTFGDLWEKHTALTAARKDALAISEGLYSPNTVENNSPNTTESVKIRRTVGIKNSQDKVVLNYHVGQPINLLTVENNAKQSSNWAARMFFNGKPVEQFVSPTDKVFAGFPSVGYNVLVYTTTGKSVNYAKVTEGETNDNFFVNNSFAGIIQFNKERNKNHIFAASVFEYTGDYLDSVIGDNSKYATKEDVHEANITYSTDSVINNESFINGITLEHKGFVNANKEPIVDSQGDLTDIVESSEIYGDYFTLSSTSALFDDERKTFHYPNYFVTASEADKAINARIGELQNLAATFEVVESLDSITSPQKGVVYLVPNDSEGDGALNGKYNEYICTNVEQRQFENIGSTEVDLSNYATKEYAKQTAVDFGANTIFAAAGGLEANKTYLNDDGSQTDYPTNSTIGLYYTIAVDTAWYNPRYVKFHGMGGYTKAKDVEEFVKDVVNGRYDLGASYVVVESLGDPEEADPSLIYLVPNGNEGGAIDGSYTEYIVTTQGEMTNGQYKEYKAWKKIGTSQPDLTQYATHQDVGVIISEKDNETLSTNYFDLTKNIKFQGNLVDVEQDQDTKEVTVTINNTSNNQQIECLADEKVNAQRIWDLNNFIYECLRKRKNDSSKYQWVEDYVLNSPNIYIELDNEDFKTKKSWIEYVKAGNDPYSPLIFINDMYNVSDLSNMSTQAGYSPIGEFVKKMFLQLDKDAGKEWMSDDSFSKKYLKTGLSIKYITYLSIDGNNADLPRPTDFSTIANLDSDYVYPSYTISIYTSPTILDVLDVNGTGQVIFHEPILDYTKFTFDSLTKNKNWNYLISEQEMKITRDYLKSLIKDSTDGLKASHLYTGTLALFTNIDDTINYVNRENGKGETVGAVDFGSKHFIVGQKINKITIPYDTPDNANVGNHKCHLMMEIFTDNSGTPSQTYSSVNKDSYSTTKTKKEYNFIFNNVVIPSSYNFVRLSFSEDSQVRSAYKKFRILPLRKLGTTDNPNKDESKVFEEDDACYLHWESSGNISGGANRVGYVEVYYGDTTDILDYVSPDITEDKAEDDISLATISAIKNYFTGKTPTNITISDGQASALENQQSVYGNITNDNVLSLGVVSANDNTMGVSKLFTGTLSTATSDADDTAVSLQSIQAMYNTLASLIDDITTDNLPEYNKKIEELEDVIKSNNETITNLTNQITILQNNVVILDNINNGKYDVSRANNTAPDGSQWNTIVHDANNLKINYITYDDTNNLGMMYGTIGDN